MKKRSVVLCVILSVLTFGIFFLMWAYFLSKEIIEELDFKKIDNPVINVVFLIFGSVPYLLWWNYKLSSYLTMVESQNGVTTDFWYPPLSVIYGVVLHQSRINRVLATKFSSEKPVAKKRAPSTSSASSSSAPKKAPGTRVRATTEKK